MRIHHHLFYHLKVWICSRVKPYREMEFSLANNFCIHFFPSSFYRTSLSRNMERLLHNWTSCRLRLKLTLNGLKIFTVMFEKVKELLISPSILIYPDKNEQFILTTDASGKNLVEFWVKWKMDVIVQLLLQAELWVKLKLIFTGTVRF